MESKIIDFQNRKLKAADSEGNEYNTISELWTKELDPTMIELEKKDDHSRARLKGERVGGKDQWYSKQVTYWDQ